MPERLGVGWVSRLFTVPGWRGRGIGAALLTDAFGRFWRRGRQSVGLGVDAQNPHGAVALYEGLGMTALRRYDVFDLGTTETPDAWTTRESTT